MREAKRRIEKKTFRVFFCLFKFASMSKMVSFGLVLYKFFFLLEFGPEPKSVLAHFGLNRRESARVRK